MNAIRLPKKFRDICTDIRNGNENAIVSLETMSKYPNQITAVKAEIAYFNQDYQTALNLDLELLPSFDEWHYSNVANEHLAATAVAALRLHREQEVTDALQSERRRTLDNPEANKQRAVYCEKMVGYIEKRVLPFSDWDDFTYQEPSEPKSLGELWANVMAIDKKSQTDSPQALSRFFYQCYTYGSAEDALSVFNRMPAEIRSAGVYEQAILLALHIGDTSLAVRLMEELAASRLWFAASPTQVRPMRFYTNPVLCKSIVQGETMQRIKEAGCLGERWRIRETVD